MRGRIDNRPYTDLVPGELNQKKEYFIVVWQHPTDSTCRVTNPSHGDHFLTVSTSGVSAADIELAVQFLPDQMAVPRCSHCDLEYTFVSAQPK